MRRAVGLAALLGAFGGGCGAPTYHGEGDVVGVDAGARQVTINHEDIPGLMPAMTMTFAVRSPSALADVTAGSRVRFDLVKEGELLVVTRLVPLGRASGGELQRHRLGVAGDLQRLQRHPLGQARGLQFDRFA